MAGKGDRYRPTDNKTYTENYNKINWREVSNVGDMADMALNGDCCEICGDYIGEGAGYPRLCGNCKYEC